MIPLGVLGASRQQSAAGGGSLSYIGHVSSTADLQFYTFNSVPIGPAAADRHVILGISGRGINSTTRNLELCTVNGIAAAIDATYYDTDSNSSAIASIPVPTGTTANIYIQFAFAAVRRAAIAVYAITGAGSLIVADEDGEANLTNDATCSANLATAPGDFVVAACMNASLAGLSWSGATEDMDIVAEVQFGAASTVATGATTALSVTGAVQPLKTLAAAAYRSA